MPYYGTRWPYSNGAYGYGSSYSHPRLWNVPNVYDDYDDYGDHLDRVYGPGFTKVVDDFPNRQILGNSFYQKRIGLCNNIVHKILKLKYYARQGGRKLSKNSRFEIKKLDILYKKMSCDNKVDVCRQYQKMRDKMEERMKNGSIRSKKRKQETKEWMQIYNFYLSTEYCS
ncbi:hypothetical protein SNEBB_009394 [Seison nebaliae]|nr:hypothetical protein SNEBB_009394 [Seison nebaliae]